MTTTHHADIHDTDTLLAALHEALEAHAADDDLDPAGGTSAGRALLRLAAQARAAAADLGADPGTPLTGGPGIVVLRDLAAATRLLERARAAASTGQPDRAPEAVPVAA